MILASSIHPPEVIASFLVFITIAIFTYFLATRKTVEHKAPKLKTIISIVCILLSAFGLFEVFTSMCPSNYVFGLICSSAILGTFICKADENLVKTRRYLYFIMTSSLSSVYILILFITLIKNN